MLYTGKLINFTFAPGRISVLVTFKGKVISNIHVTIVVTKIRVHAMNIEINNWE